MMLYFSHPSVISFRITFESYPITHLPSNNERGARWCLNLCILLTMYLHCIHTVTSFLSLSCLGSDKMINSLPSTESVDLTQWKSTLRAARVNQNNHVAAGCKTKASSRLLYSTVELKENAELGDNYLCSHQKWPFWKYSCYPLLILKYWL